jgi:hypothetical protein
MSKEVKELCQDIREGVSIEEEWINIEKNS